MAENWKILQECFKPLKIVLRYYKVNFQNKIVLKVLFINNFKVRVSCLFFISFYIFLIFVVPNLMFIYIYKYSF